AWLRLLRERKREESLRAYRAGLPMDESSLLLVVLSAIDSGVVICRWVVREKSFSGTLRGTRTRVWWIHIARSLRCRMLNHHPSAEGAVKPEGSRVRLHGSSVS
ncbi:unnamed protein product, partial [Ectocarpus sp. 4 AP-2014]